MKLGQVIEHKKRIFLKENHSEIEARKLVPDLFFFLKKKALYEVNASDLQLTIYFDSPQLGTL